MKVRKEGRNWWIPDKWTPEVIRAIDPSVPVSAKQWKEITDRLRQVENPCDLTVQNRIVKAVLEGKKTDSS